MTPLMHITPAAGDVWAVATGGGWAAKLIDIGQVAHNLPAIDNHVVIPHHIDANGRWQGIEGRPGGVGWADLTRYLHHPATVTNQAQPKTPAQRANVLRTAEAMIGVAYDWQAILADANRDLGIGTLWTQDWHGNGYPGHVVCSSLAAWTYKLSGLDHPTVGHERFCQPGDWTEFDWHLEVSP